MLSDERYIEAAGRAAGFILDRMRQSDGRLLHTFKDGQAKLDAYLDDYASLIDGLTRLYESTGDPRWVESALDLAAIMIDEFSDAEQGGFFFTGRRHEALIARQKDIHDNATPSGSGLAATALLRLGALTGRADLTRAGNEALEAIQTVLEREPAACGQSLIALDFLLGTVTEFAVIAGPDSTVTRSVLDTISSKFHPRKVVAPATPDQSAAPRGQSRLARESTAPARSDDNLCLRERHLQRAEDRCRRLGEFLLTIGSSSCLRTRILIGPTRRHRTQLVDRVVNLAGDFRP